MPILLLLRCLHVREAGAPKKGFLACYPDLVVDCDCDRLFKDFSHDSSYTHWNYTGILDKFSDDKQGFIQYCRETGEYPEFWFLCAIHAQNAEGGKDFPAAFSFLNMSAESLFFDEAKRIAHNILRSKEYAKLQVNEQTAMTKACFQPFWKAKALCSFDGPCPSPQNRFQ